MPLLIDSDSTFDIVLRYHKKDNGELEFLEGETKVAGEETETFTFRRPTWKDAKSIMEKSMLPGGEGIDPMAYVDSKVRILLKAWTLKDDKGISVPVTKIDMLPPSAIIRLSGEIDSKTGPSIIGAQQQSHPQ